MYLVYVLRKIKSNRLCIGMTDDFDEEFSNNPQSVLVLMSAYKKKNDAEIRLKYLKSKKGNKELKNKIKKKTLGILG